MVPSAMRRRSATIPCRAADRLQAVFDPFVQIGKQANREGTGLGLAISRELASAMGGGLVATSSGQGSTFTLTLQLVEAT